MDGSLLKNTIDKYISELSGIRRVSVNTIDAYKADLTQFESFIVNKNITDLKSISERTIRLFIVHLTESDLSRTSISRKLSVLRGYFNYLEQHDFITVNPMEAISNPKTKRQLPEIITLDSFEKILKLISEESESGKSKFIEYKLIFELLYGCALRVSELCNLNFGDIDLNRKNIRVTGKGNKTRFVPIGDKSIQVYNEYIASIDNHSINSPLFLTSTGKRIYPKFVRRLVKKYLSKVSDISKKSPHILRHTAATHMLNNGADLLGVKEILGHENLSTTQIYTHVSIERLKEAYKKAHPKS